MTDDPKKVTGKPKLLKYMSTTREITHFPYLYTWGYQSRTVAELEEILRKYNIARVIDVRIKPWSKYQPEFRKDHLEIFPWYDHRGSLGNNHNSLPWLKGPHWHGGVKAVANLLKLHSVLLMCLERNPEMCHRKEVADAIFHEVPCQIMHLGFVKPSEQLNLL